MSRVNIRLLCHISGFKNINRTSSKTLHFSVRQTVVAAGYDFHSHINRFFTCKPSTHEDVTSRLTGSANPSDRTITRARSFKPADISIEQYHILADSYLSELEEKLNELQEENEQIDVEFSVSSTFMNK